MSTQQHGEKPNMTRVVFGNAVVVGPAPSADETAARVRQGQIAMAGLAKALVTPGVVLERKPGVPLYSADSQTMGLFVRELDGVVTRGRFLDGAFVPV